MNKVAVLGGTSLLKSTYFSHLEPKTVSTPHGNVVLYTDGDAGRLVFLQRHHADADAADGPDTYRPPHLINHRANLHAVRQQQVDLVIAVCSVGSLNAHLGPGTILVPDDYSSLLCPPYAFHDDARAHIVPGVDARLRDALLAALRDARVDALDARSAVYVQVPGPRFETAAEIRFLANHGDVIGMTAAHEATIAKELGLRYALFTMVDNMGNGLGDKSLTNDSFKASVESNRKTVEQSVSAVLEWIGNTEV